MHRQLFTALLAVAAFFAIAPAGFAESLRDPTRPYLEPTPVTKAQSRFHLSAIFVSDDRRVAILNGKRVKVGDLVEGAKVIEILNDELRLSYDGRLISTRLASSGLRNQK